MQTQAAGPSRRLFFRRLAFSRPALQFAKSQIFFPFLTAANSLGSS